MNTKQEYKLFFLKQNPYFDKGTLFELADEIISEASLDKSFDQRFNTVPAELYENFGYFLPDRGDGIEGFIDQDKVLKCPDFAENVPPGKCPAKITSIRLLSRADSLLDENVNNIKIFGVRVEENLHFQKIIIPLPSDFPEIKSVTVKNRLKNIEIEQYENPALEIIDEGKGLCLHIGYFAPGFYETEINLPKGKFIRLRFIKFFPEYFKEKYPFIEANPPKEEHTFYIGEVGFRPEDYLNKPVIKENGKFSDKILNIALEIKTEWGENFRKPIDERILQKFPDLTSAEISELDKIAGEAESFIYHLAELELNGEILESNILENARQKFLWLNDANLFRLKNIGMYYARR
jgi:hypothetical protein